MDIGAMMQAQFAISYPLSKTGKQAVWTAAGLKSGVKHISAITALWLSRKIKT